jgi:putative FmdB family regulatory protein
MPDYDFICENCKKPFHIQLSYSEYGKSPVNCIYCGSESVRRNIRRVRFTRTNSTDLDSFSDFDNLDQEDPRALASMMRSVSREIGEDLPPDLNEVVDRLEAGEAPEEIEKDLPVGDDGVDF